MLSINLSEAAKPGQAGKNRQDCRIVTTAIEHILEIFHFLSFPMKTFLFNVTFSIICFSNDFESVNNFCLAPSRTDGAQEVENSVRLSVSL